MIAVLHFQDPEGREATTEEVRALGLALVALGPEIERLTGREVVGLHVATRAEITGTPTGSMVVGDAGRGAPS